MSECKIVKIRKNKRENHRKPKENKKVTREPFSCHLKFCKPTNYLKAFSDNPGPFNFN